jgi:hypothetical protein
MNTLTKSDIGRAVDAIRELSDVIEKLHKSTWPDEDRNDELRKSDLTDTPRASTAMQQGDIIIKRAQAVMDDLSARMARLEAARDAKPASAYTTSRGHS